jgi:hypothetical protein
MDSADPERFRQLISRAEDPTGGDAIRHCPEPSPCTKHPILHMKDGVLISCVPSCPLEARRVAWSVAYRHSIRTDEAGIKFLQQEAEAIDEERRLKSLGYVVTKIAPTAKTRMDAFLATAQIGFDRESAE